MENERKSNKIRESESTKSARLQLIILIIGLIIALLIYIITNVN
jgi:uncharacterized integral membrane protein